jgi:phage repressor protein C with HTH and peptisase S24 domain
MDVPKWLTEARKTAGLTQEIAGSLVDVTKGNWSAWETGKHSPSIQQLARISSVLHFPLPNGLGTNTEHFVPIGPDAPYVTNVTTSTATAESVSSQAEIAGRVTYSRRVPVTGTARLRDDGCFEEIETMGGTDGFVVLQTPDGWAHALRIRGDQMAPAIRDGWFVVVSPGSTPAVGEYVAVVLRNGQRMVRELLYQRADSVAVMEVNGQARQTIPIEEIERIHAVAAVIPPSQWRPT